MVLGPDRPAEQARRVVQLLADRGALTAGPVDPTASTTADHPPSAHSTPSTHPQRSSHATQRSLVVVRSCRARDLGVLATVAALTREVGGTTTVLMPAAALAGDDVTSLLGCHGADAVVVGTGSEPRPFATAAGTLAAQGYTDVVGVSTPWGREVMARVAARLSMGLLSDLHELRGGPDGLRGAKMAPGGGELVEVRSSSAIRLLTVVDPAPFAGASPRPAAATTWLEVGHDDAVRNRVETVVDDWDALSRSPVVIGVGRGVREFELTLLEPLRRVLGAEYAATRKVTDEGWLPHSRQVGITGRSIAPALYLAVGISGSPDHLSSLRDAGTVVAVNEDPRARVFDHCDIGVVARWQDVVGPLTAALVAAGSDRGGAVPAPELLRRS
jgi:electron transfer flavoprotein alpha subunit